MMNATSFRLAANSLFVVFTLAYIPAAHHFVEHLLAPHWPRYYLHFSAAFAFSSTVLYLALATLGWKLKFIDPLVLTLMLIGLFFLVAVVNMNFFQMFFID